MDDDLSINLEKHETKNNIDQRINGTLTVIWRDWDNILKFHPKMVYVSHVNPHEIKGPHLHKERTSYFYCINGEIVIILQDKDSQYHEIKINSKESKLVSISNGIAAAIINPSKSLSKILVLADISWKPNDDEMKNSAFNDYEWKKWN